ncbi:hypothetical protein Acor_16370 [Acrocarpospora corrugata]|uniref:DUF305 domain-containing protein n=1 Tax=Acrocarpospora corrugata TaxID=35763 RepID=A0A5M3VSS2_9ACTN|nr:DUF305 domain-containing protein [Acrocarpospora corrugata]GER99573.1 hypothetical protein Acor_16370 [Acrocarpospora corrugata]
MRHLLILSFLVAACAPPPAAVTPQVSAPPPVASTPLNPATLNPNTVNPNTVNPSTVNAATLNPDPLSTGSINATDIAWAQLMIPMHEGLLELLDQAPARLTNPDLAHLAAQVATTHRTELPALRRILTRAGITGANPHEGHDMPGMVTQADLTLLTPITGPTFERLFIAHLRGHLEQVTLISRAEGQSGKDPSAHTLAAAMVKSRTAQLATLDHLTSPATTN